MIKAYAKVNLKLKVIKKLNNGFHELEMINTKISLYDSIYIKESICNKIKYSNFKINSEEDTILKVINALQNKYPNLPFFNIYIKKRIPIGSGLGGMSSDAAYIVKYINEKYNLKKTVDELSSFLLPFGKDMCYALYEEPSQVLGCGEIVKKINLKLPNKIIILNPMISVKTKDIFDYYDLECINKKDTEIFENHLEYAFRKKYPEMNKLFNELIDLNIGKIQLTGSGSCIIIFNENKKVIKMLKKKYKNYKVNI